MQGNALWIIDKFCLKPEHRLQPEVMVIRLTIRVMVEFIATGVVADGSGPSAANLVAIGLRQCKADTAA